MIWEQKEGQRVNLAPAANLPRHLLLPEAVQRQGEGAGELLEAFQCSGHKVWSSGPTKGREGS